MKKWANDYLGVQFSSQVGYNMAVDMVSSPPLRANGSVSDRDYVKELRYAQISHQTGAQSIAFPDQTMEFTSWQRHATATQSM